MKYQSLNNNNNNSKLQTLAEFAVVVVFVFCFLLKGLQCHNNQSPHGIWKTTTKKYIFLGGNCMVSPTHQYLLTNIYSPIFYYIIYIIHIIIYVYVYMFLKIKWGLYLPEHTVVIPSVDKLSSFGSSSRMLNTLLEDSFPTSYCSPCCSVSTPTLTVVKTRAAKVLKTNSMLVLSSPSCKVWKAA